MTTGTAPLIDRQRDEVEAAADAATIAGLRKDMLDHLTRRVAEQMLEIKALREVVMTGERYIENRGRDRATRGFVEYARYKGALHDARDAGYLPSTEERRP